MLDSSKHGDWGLGTGDWGMTDLSLQPPVPSPHVSPFQSVAHDKNDFSEDGM
jgi:hypothetical protein